jgi:hypothetical protein
MHVDLDTTRKEDDGFGSRVGGTDMEDSVIPILYRQHKTNLGGPANNGQLGACHHHLERPELDMAENVLGANAFLFQP